MNAAAPYEPPQCTQGSTTCEYNSNKHRIPSFIADTDGPVSMWEEENSSDDAPVMTRVCQETSLPRPSPMGLLKQNPGLIRPSFTLSSSNFLCDAGVPTDDVEAASAAQSTDNVKVSSTAAARCVEYLDSVEQVTCDLGGAQLEAPLTLIPRVARDGAMSPLNVAAGIATAREQVVPVGGIDENERGNHRHASAAVAGAGTATASPGANEDEEHRAVAHVVGAEDWLEAANALLDNVRP